MLAALTIHWLKFCNTILLRNSLFASNSAKQKASFAYSHKQKTSLAELRKIKPASYADIIHTNKSNRKNMYD